MIIASGSVDNRCRGSGASFAVAWKAGEDSFNVAAGIALNRREKGPNYSLFAVNLAWPVSPHIEEGNPAPGGMSHAFVATWPAR